jgi:hypothetical protein
LAQVFFAEGDDMVDALAADCSDQPLGKTVLPWRAWRNGPIDLGPSSPHQSCPDCIIAMRGYDFREGHGPVINPGIDVMCQLRTS